MRGVGVGAGVSENNLKSVLIFECLNEILIENMNWKSVSIKEIFIIRTKLQFV